MFEIATKKLMLLYTLCMLELTRKASKVSMILHILCVQEFDMDEDTSLFISNMIKLNMKNIW